MEGSTLFTLTGLRRSSESPTCLSGSLANHLRLPLFPLFLLLAVAHSALRVAVRRFQLTVLTLSSHVYYLF